MAEEPLENEIKVNLVLSEPNVDNQLMLCSSNAAKVVLDDAKNSINLIINGAGLKLMAALRRISKGKIPTMAIEKIEFEEGKSSIEPLLCSRLAKIPLLSNDVNTFLDKKECKCASKKNSNCSNCCVEFTLDIEGGLQPYLIQSKDLVSNHPSVKVAHGDIPIIKLKAGESLKIKALAFKGIGYNNACWNPATIFKFDETKEPSYFTPPLENSKPFDEEFSKVYNLEVESSGSLSPGRILLSACDIIEKGFDSFLSQTNEVDF